MAQLHLELSNMYSLDRMLSKEDNIQKRTRIMSSMKSLMNEVISSPHFTFEIVKQFPKWDWSLPRLLSFEKFDYDLIYTLSRYGKDWNRVLDLLIQRKDFSMTIVKMHPCLNWKDYGYLLVKVKDFTSDWMETFPEWSWNVSYEFELTNRINKMSMAIDSAFSGKLPVPVFLDSRSVSPINPPKKRKRVEFSPDRENDVLECFKVEELSSPREEEVCVTPEKDTQRPILIVEAPRKRLHRKSYEF